MQTITRTVKLVLLTEAELKRLISPRRIIIWIAASSLLGLLAGQLIWWWLVG